MADCIVILECCTGQTGCNKKITIGYLKSFIMSGSTHLIKTTAGTDVNVNSSKPDAYEPTYAELTSGSILPIYSDGGNNRGASSVDGITIGGSYTADETVGQTDLTLTYTRFKSLSISAGKTAFDKCGDSTTMSYTYTLAKTVKGISVCNPLTYSYTSTDVRDTSNTAPNKVTFSAGCNWINVSGTGISADQNGTGHSSTRTCNISASVMYKGNTQTAGNTVSISQPGVGGNWIYSSTTYDSLSIDTYDDTEYDCDGGSFSIDGTGYYTDYYYWRDDCGNNYYNETTTSSDSEYAGEDSGSFPNCPDAHNQSTDLSITWHGITKTMTFRQICTCEDCTNYNDYGECSTTATAEKCGGLIEVSCSMPITTHTRTWVDGVCVDTTGTTTQRQSATVFVPENATQSEKTHPGSVTTEEGGTINYTITQEAGPCEGCTGEVTTYQYSNVTTSITACQTDVPVSIPYTATTTYDNCSTTVSYGTATTSYTVSKNETSSSTSYTKTFVGIGAAEATITINQGAGPCTCLCSMLTVSPTSYTWTYDKTSTDTNDITISSAACTSSITVNTLTHFNATVGTGKVTVSPKGTNTSGSNYEETLTISYKADTTNCSSSVTLTQTAQDDPCRGKQCSELTVTGVTTAFDKNAHANVTIGNFSKSSCATITAVTSSETWLYDVSADTSTNTIKGSMNAQGCGTSSRPTTVTLKWSVDGNNGCYSSWTVSQNGDSSSCPCTNYEYNATTSPENLSIDKCGGNDELTFSVKRRCTSPAEQSWSDYTAYYILEKISEGDYFTYSTGTTKVTFSKTTPNTGASALISRYKISFYKESSKTNLITSINFNVSQDGGCVVDPCAGKQCGEFALSNKKSSCFSKAKHTAEEIADFSASTCVNVDNVTVSSNQTWLTPGIDKTNKKIIASMDARSCATSQRSAVVTVSWTVDGNTCNDTINVCQDGDSTPCSNPCSCSNFSASTTALTFNSNGYLMNTINWKKDPDCDDTFTILGDSNVETCSLNSDGTISIKAKANTSLSDSESVTVKIYLGSTECTSWKMTGSVPARDCECSDLDNVIKETTSIGSGGSSNFVVWKTSNKYCSLRIEATSGNCDSIFTSVGAGLSGSYYVVSATASSNTSENSKSCTIGYKYYKTGTDGVPCDTGETTVTVAGTGACDCTAANAAIGNYSETIPATGGTGYVSYTADCGTVKTTTDYGRITVTSIDTTNKRIYFSMSANDTSNERYDYINLWIEGLTTYCTYTKITQYGKPSCDCNSFSATADSTTFPQTGGTITVWKITHSCGTVEALSASCDSLITSVFPSSVSDGTEIKATANANSGENDVTCTVGYRFKPNESSSCTSGGTTVTLPGTGICDCDASNISIQGLSTNLPYSGGTELQIGTYTANCTTNLTLYADGLTNVTYSNGKIYANVPANTSFTSEESYQIKCKFGSTECGETDGVSQDKKPCNCTTANFQIDPTTMDRVYDDDNFYVNYSADCGSVSATVVSGSDWITGITVNNDDVTFDITENTSTTSARTGSVKLYLVGNESCSASTTITQGKAPCNCTTSNFNVDTTTKYISSGASTLAATIKYSADCGTVSATVTTGSDWITGLSVYQSSVFHDVDLKVTANTGAERSGTVNVYLVDYENSCTSAVTVVQAAGSTPCACGDFAITSAPYSATCISKASHSNETIATYSGLCGSITSITVSDSNGLFNGTPTTSSTNSIIANINANCGVERTATVTVNYNNGGTCTAKTFDVKQCAGGISSISANPTSLDCNGGRVTFTANTR